jgi:hypothetical protein
MLDEVELASGARALILEAFRHALEGATELLAWKIVAIAEEG